jgi:hypothetical protein
VLLIFPGDVPEFLLYISEAAAGLSHNDEERMHISS